MKNDKKRNSRLWLALPTALLAGVVNVSLFFLFMVLYGHVLDPGHEESYYQAVASSFGPYASIIGGIPVFFIAGLLLRRLLGERALRVAILAWSIYVAIDLAIIIAAAADQLMNFLPHILVSFSTKLAAIYFGARTTAKSLDGEQE